MDINEIKANARERMNGFCVLCKECDGVWCAGKVPGMGGAGSGNSFKRNHTMLQQIKVILRTLHNVANPHVDTALFGEKLRFPVFAAPITGTKFNMGGYISDNEYACDVIAGSVAAGTLGMIGDTGDPSCYEAGIAAIKKANGKGIAIIKPRVDNQEIIKRIRMAEDVGAIAVGIDVDGAGLVTMKLFGQPVGPKTLEDLQILVASTKLPFIVKGILSVDEAKICVQAGVKAIVVSNHGGRCLNETLSAVEVLAEIAQSVGKEIIVLADGNVREGVDVFKFLALGAHGVLVGRPVIWGAIGGRQEGVKMILDNLHDGLLQTMILTGSCNLTQITQQRIKHVSVG